MIGGMTVVQKVGENIGALFPMRFVKSNQLGVRVKRGVAVANLPPGGPYLHIPGFHEVERVEAAEQGVNVLTQSITTTDDVAVTASVNVSYIIVDAVKLITKAYDLDTTLNCDIMRHVARAIRSKSYRGAIEGQEAMELEIRATLQKKVRRWGVRILEVGVTDLVKARQYRLFADPATAADTPG